MKSEGRPTLKSHLTIITAYIPRQNYLWIYLPLPPSPSLATPPRKRGKEGEGEGGVTSAVHVCNQYVYPYFVSKPSLLPPRRALATTTPPTSCSAIARYVAAYVYVYLVHEYVDLRAPSNRIPDHVEVMSVISSLHLDISYNFPF